MMYRYALFVTSGFVLLSSCSHPVAFEWPVRRVEAITARLLMKPRGSLNSKEFQIKKDQLERVMSALTPPYPLRREEATPTTKDAERGLLRIQYSDKSEDKIVYYDGGKNPLIYTINGRLYVRGGQNNPTLRKEQIKIYNGFGGEYLKDYDIYLDESDCLDRLLKACAEEIK